MALLFENLRQLISVVDELRDVGLQNYISLPRIAAVGTQSSGKSSAIESIVGLDFLPRGGGVVTRRPLELRLVHLHAEDHKGEQAWAIFDQLPDKKFTNFNEVRQEIERQTDLVAGTKKGIVNDPIVMTVYSTTAPDLTVIDLPGVTRVAVAGSDQTGDIEKVTRDMTLHYISDPRTIILAVLPANQDVSTSDALQLARQVDPQGRRTIGVVTKIDIMDHGTDASRMLRGEDIPLKLGYVGVKMRSQADIVANKPVKASLEDEKDWFAKHRFYSKLPPGMVGTPVLIEKLTKILFTHIRRFLPQIKQEINDKRLKVDARLDELGHGVPLDDVERMQFMWTTLTDFCDMFKNTIKGNFDRKLQRYMANAAMPGGANSNSIEGGGSKVRQIMNDFLYDIVSDRMTVDMDDDSIGRAIEMHEGDSLPGFPSPDTFEFLSLPHLQKLISPSAELVNDVSSALDLMAQQLAQIVFRRFPKLSEAALEITQNIISRERETARAIVEQQVTCQTGYLFTNDPEYLSGHVNAENLYGIGEGAAPAKQEDTGKLGQAAQYVKDTSKSAYERVTGYDGRRAPRYSGPMVEEMRKRLDAYFSVVVWNVRDLVPKAVGYYLVRTVLDKLQFELIQALNHPEKIGILLGEPPHIQEERRQLVSQRAVLSKAHGVLTRDPTIAAAAFEADIDDESSNQSPTNQQAGTISGGAVSGAASVAGRALDTAAASVKSVASLAASAAGSAQQAVQRQAAAAVTSVASNPAVQKEMTNAALSAASNPAVQRQALGAAASMAANPTVRSTAGSTASSLFGTKTPPLGGPKKKGLFDDDGEM